MWKKGFDHDVVLLIFGSRFSAQTTKVTTTGWAQTLLLRALDSSQWGCFVQKQRELHATMEKANRKLKKRLKINFNCSISSFVIKKN